jgi:hypothetical protein
MALQKGKSWPQAVLCCFLMSCLCCAGPQKKDPSAAIRDPDAVRYRLILRDNSVDKGEAFRCYGACQSATTPDGYVRCLSECPGFETDPGYKCADYEVPPIAACLTARKVRSTDEITPGYVVLSVVAGVAITVALASVCSASASSQCGYQGVFPQQ